MFGVPAPTEFDVRFRLLGIPVRVHPLFWVMAAWLGQELLKSEGTLFILWIGCVFVSILVHEFGHALVARRFGADPGVILYMLGGLCVHQNDRETPRQRLLILIMGPGAGFLLMGLTIGVSCLWLGLTPLQVWERHLFQGRTLPPRLAAAAIWFLIEINFFWGVFNLFPIMPLDGGQIASVCLTMHSPRNGRRRGYIVSILTAGLLAFYFVRIESYTNAIFIGLLALSSYQVLQAYHYQSKYGASFEDESDWWKR